MKAFNPLFRNSFRNNMGWGRRAAPVGGGKLRMLGLAGIGYGIYRFLQSERGRELTSKLAGQARDIGERMRVQSNDIVSRSKSRLSNVDRHQSAL